MAAVNEAYETGDLESWRRHVGTWFEEDVILEAGGAFTEGEWRGREGAVGFVANQMEVLTGMWVRVDELIEAGDERLVVAMSFGGRARHTGIEVKLSPFHVYDLRAGRVARWRIFATREEALAAS